MSVVAICCILFAFVWPALAHAQSGQSLKSRLDRLERDIQTLSRAVYRGEKPPEPAEQGGGNAGDSDFRANMQVQISDLEQRLSALTGKYERNRNRIDKLEKRLETALSDIEMRLKRLENTDNKKQQKPSAQKDTQADADSRADKTTSARDLAQSVADDAKSDQSSDEATLGTIRAKPDATASGTNGAGPRAESKPDTANESGQATDAYEQAFARLQNGKYEAAARAFQAFMDKHPDHKLAQNAEYWLGESYYARNQYKKAARAFANGYQNHPKGNKGADNLLKLGLSLEAMDREQDACVALNRLDEKFGDSEGAVIRRAEKESKRIGCE